MSTAQATSDPGAFAYFWAKVIHKPCPDCGNKTAAGFDRNDPEASEREATSCVGCTADKLHNEVVFSTAEIGYPANEQGPCTTCLEPARRYGPEGQPRCGACIEGDVRAVPVRPVPVADGRAYDPMPRSDRPWLQPQECSGTAECDATGTKLYASGWRCDSHLAVSDLNGAFIAIRGELPEGVQDLPVPEVKIPAPRAPVIRARPQPETEPELSLS